jgi:hypothetical protein
MQATLQRPQTAEAIRRLADSLLQATAVGDVCSAAVAAVTGALGADRAAILLDSHGELRVAAAHGVSDHFHDAIERLPSSMLDATAVHESLADGGGAVLAVPVCFDGRV